jgi:4'-phosphopantetheinyl transferase
MILYTFNTVDKFDEVNKRELLNRSLLDYCANKNIAIPENGIHIERTSTGKPEITNMESIHFSISHTKDLFICAIQGEALGIDIEDIFLKNALNNTIIDGMGISKRYIGIAKRFFSDDENEYLIANGIKGFFQIWVRKEAYIKAKGTGISEGLNKFSVIKNGEFVESIEGMHLQELNIGKYIKKSNSQVLGAYCSKIPLDYSMHVELSKLRSAI